MNGSERAHFDKIAANNWRECFHVTIAMSSNYFTAFHVVTATSARKESDSLLLVAI
jgi:hypothetical protein